MGTARFTNLRRSNATTTLSRDERIRANPGAGTSGANATESAFAVCHYCAGTLEDVSTINANTETQVTHDRYGFAKEDLSCQVPMIDHETAILNNLNPGFRECLGYSIVANSGLQPDRLGLLRQNIFDVRRHFL